MRFGRLARHAAAMVAFFVFGFLTWAAVWSQRAPDLEQVPDAVVGHVTLDLLLGLAVAAIAPAWLRQHKATWAAGAMVLGLLLPTAVSAFSVPVGLVALIVIGSWRDGRWAAAALAVFTLLLVVEGLIAGQPLAPLDMAIGVAVLGALPLLLGLYLGSRRALLASYREAAESARREQAALVAQARAHERITIAREMHDTLSHRLSLISLHAGGLAFRPGVGAERVEEASRLIQQTAQAASEELHSLLTLLRDDPRDARPETTVASLDALVAEFAVQGVTAWVQLDEVTRSRLEALGTLASRALACVVREGLGNAAKHAPGRPVSLVFTPDADGLELCVSNALAPGHTPLPGGYGLVGLGERLTAAGGRLSAGASGATYELKAWVPWT